MLSREYNRLKKKPKKQPHQNIAVARAECFWQVNRQFQASNVFLLAFFITILLTIKDFTEEKYKTKPRMKDRVLLLPVSPSFQEKTTTNCVHNFNS